MKPVYYLFSFFLILFCVGVIPSKAYAQQATDSGRAQEVVDSPINLTLSPITISINTKPNEKRASIIKIRNNGDTTETLSATFGTFTTDETGEKPILLDPSEHDQSLSWISIDEPTFSVSPGEWKTLTVTFSPPEDAALSYYYTLLFERKTNTIDNGQTKIKGAPALLILTTVDSPQAKKELSLTSFSASHVLEFLPQTFYVKIKNSGNVHVVPKGNIFIDGQGKKDLTVLSLNPSGLSVLPGTTREFRVTWDDGFPNWEKTQNKTSLRWDFEHVNNFRYGKYDAHLLMVYDNGQRDVPIESQTSFWVIPARILLVLFAIPSLPALTVFIIMKIRISIMQRKLP